MTLSNLMNDTIKCVVVGDGSVGKTSLLISYANNKFPSEYVPTVFDHYAVTVIVQGRPITLALFDTAGQEEYDRLRLLTYPQTDVFLVCFSVISKDSFSNVSQTWVPEIKQYCPKAPFILVGTQCDLRDDPARWDKMKKRGQGQVTVEEATKQARDVGAVGYVECSALTQKNLREVFNEAMLAVMQPSKPKKPSRIRRYLCLGKV